MASEEQCDFVTLAIEEFQNSIGRKRNWEPTYILPCLVMGLCFILRDSLGWGKTLLLEIFIFSVICLKYLNDNRKATESQLSHLIDVYQWVMQRETNSAIQVRSSLEINTTTCLIETLAPYMTKQEDIYKFALKSGHKLDTRPFCFLDSKITLALKKAFVSFELVKGRQRASLELAPFNVNNVGRACFAWLSG